ncbi:MAG TPA: hypothetical protein VMY39_05905, partial [Planctomycetota bacterium]|nr:hypothetical protein [Planctomycetota bacterium]
MEVLTKEFRWAIIAAAGIAGILILVKAPELLVAMLVSGARFIQMSFRIFGLDVDRRTFGVVGAVVFLPIVVLFFIVRLVQTREMLPMIGRRNYPFMVVAIALGVLLLIGLTYTHAPQYGTQKTGEYFIFGMAPMLLAVVLMRDGA